MTSDDWGESEETRDEKRRRCGACQEISYCRVSPTYHGDPLLALQGLGAEVALLSVDWLCRWRRNIGSAHQSVVDLDRRNDQTQASTPLQPMLVGNHRRLRPASTACKGR